MAGFLDKILGPIVTKAFDMLAPRIEKLLSDKMDDILKAVVVTITETTAELVTRTADDITDLIPGEVDDQIVTGILSKVFDTLGWNRR